MPMRDWGGDVRPASIWMRIEFTLLLAFAVRGLVALAFAIPANAHPGGLAADGCHNDRKNGGRHCHRGANAGQQQTSREMVRFIIRIAMPRAGQA
jgi:hypothetical protein